MLPLRGVARAPALPRLHPWRHSAHRCCALRERGTQSTARAALGQRHSRATRGGGAAELRKPKPHLDYMASAEAPAGYRPNVGLCLVNRNDKVLVASRLDQKDAWQMPQGGIDAGETPAAAAMRELREETGVTSAEVIGEVPSWLCYDFPPQVKDKLARLWGETWEGQAQRWFLLRFTGSDNEINLLGDGSEKPEFSAWKWASMEEVEDQVMVQQPAAANNGN